MIREAGYYFSTEFDLDNAVYIGSTAQEACKWLVKQDIRFAIEFLKDMCMDDGGDLDCISDNIGELICMIILCKDDMGDTFECILTKQLALMLYDIWMGNVRRLGVDEVIEEDEDDEPTAYWIRFEASGMTFKNVTPERFHSYIQSLTDEKKGFEIASEPLWGRYILHVREE